MPLRADAKPPGVFIRDHLVSVGGTDYVQAIYRAYKDHLVQLKLRSRASRHSFSKYIWVANQLGLVVFDHAASQSRWGAEEDGGVVEKGYTREHRPQAPSPRHYYRLVDAQDPRWLDMDRAYREMMGLPEPEKPLPRERKPRPEKKPARPRAPVAQKKPVPKPKPAKKPPPPAAAAADIEQYIKRIRGVSRQLGPFSKNPSSSGFNDIETALVALGEEVVTQFEKAQGKRREQLSDLNYNIMHGLEKLPVIKQPLEILESDATADRKRKAKASLLSGVKVVREELITGLDRILAE